MLLIKRILICTISIVIIAIVLLYISGYSYVLRGVQLVYLQGHTTAYINDFKHFDNQTIHKGTKTKKWEFHHRFNQAPTTKRLAHTHQRLGTLAFLIIKNDKLWHETYRENHTIKSKSNSFSMAKSIVVAALGSAIRLGHVHSLHQPVQDFLPAFGSESNPSFLAALTVGDLASMASGLDWDESYKSPFSITARAYFDKDIRSIIRPLQIVEQPGRKFKYLSGNTQLLAMVLEKATKSNLSEFVSTQFWKPMGMESDALWQLDSKTYGMEKAYCCIASTARDFAKFGQLLKNKGQFANQQLLTEDFVNLMTKPRFSASPEYGYGLWLSTHLGKSIFVMRGILGQYVIVIPEDNLIIVRLGNQRGKRKKGDAFTQDFYIYLEETYKMLKYAEKNPIGKSAFSGY